MHFIGTSGHGYLRITLKEFFKAVKGGFRVSNYSFINNNCVLLEEDCDCTNYLKNYRPHVWENRDKIREVHQDDINRSLYSSTYPTNVEWYKSQQEN